MALNTKFNEVVGYFDEVGNDHRDNTVVVKSASDFPPPSNGVITLEQDTGYVVDGTIDISNTLELQQGCGLYGNNWPTDEINYTGSGDIIKSSGVDFMMRDLVIKGASGTLFNVDGGSEDRFLAQSCAFVMIDNLGTIDGFKVPGFKLCDFTNYNEGLTMTGNPNKVFWTTTPMREVSNTTSLLFDANFTADFVQLESIFFKSHDNNADAIEFNGTLNDIGIVGGCIFDDTVQNRTVGFDETTVNWVFSDNSGIQDSTVRGQYSKDSPSTTTINSQASSKTDESAYEKVEGATTAGPGLERLTHSDNKFTYTGESDITISIHTSLSISGVNDTVAVAIFKNQSLLSSSSVRVTGQGSGSVSKDTFATVDVVTNDELEIFIANLDSTSNITVNDMVTMVRE